MELLLGKEPDFLVWVKATVTPLKNENIIAMAAVTYDKVPKGYADAILNGKATQDGIRGVELILSFLYPFAAPDVVVGRYDQLPALCAELIGRINKSAFDKARKYPVDERDPTIASQNFALRMGAKFVH
jgi:hypothetical protein